MLGRRHEGKGHDASSEIIKSPKQETIHALK